MKSRLWCGDPGFDKLAQATRNWCKHAAKGAGETSDAARICDDSYTSLKTQLATCSDLPAACRDHPERTRRSVSREAFEAEKPVNMEISPCRVGFTPQNGTWALSDVECSEGE